jgi:hypothetical protein
MKVGSTFIVNFALTVVKERHMLKGGVTFQHPAPGSGGSGRPRARAAAF